MTTTSIRRLGLLATALCALVTAPASAQLSTTANGPYYAVPSWSQKLTTNRFVVLANWNGEAVLDRETGLVWERAPDGDARNWLQAHIHCNSRLVGGRKGWRLPHAQELASLIDPNVAAPGPTLPAGHPFVGVGTIYWSATTVAQEPDGAWVVDFFGGIVGYLGRMGLQSVWCVRGGPGPDVQ
ncbi:MAG: DUF1566 domain-containing protein [Burkholderiaceae bacterium]|jgi:hypothetical protein|nr:DUF1566 domain-containing protein [Burkholderiaceae bacterium]